MSTPAGAALGCRPSARLSRRSDDPGAQRRSATASCAEPGSPTSWRRDWPKRPPWWPAAAHTSGSAPSAAGFRACGRGRRQPAARRVWSGKKPPTAASLSSPHRTGCSEARWGGGRAGRAGRALLSVQTPESYGVHTSLRILDPGILQKDQIADAPSQRQRPGPETGSTQGRCTRVGKGHSPFRPQNHKDPSSVGFSLRPK